MLATLLIQEGVELGEIVSLGEFMEDIRQVLDGYTWTNELSDRLTILCNIIVIFHFGKIAVENLLQGGEAFVFSKLKKPFFYMMMITAWPTIHTFIKDASIVIQEELFVNRDAVQERNSEIYNELDGGMETILKRLDEEDAMGDMETERYKDDWTGMERLYDYAISMDDRLMLAVFSYGYELSSYLDYFMYMVFYLISTIWLKIIAFGAPIAFVVSILTGGWTTLINWAKNYLSVTLWLPVSAILMGMVNSIFLRVLDTASEPILSRFSENAGTQLLSAHPLVLLHSAVNAIMTMLVLMIVFLAVKLVILAKVPSVVNSFISGGQSVAGGFTAAFMPVNVAKTAATTAVSAGAGAASAAKSGLKK